MVLIGFVLVSSLVAFFYRVCSFFRGNWVPRFLFRPTVFIPPNRETAILVRTSHCLPFPEKRNGREPSRCHETIALGSILYRVFLDVTEPFPSSVELRRVLTEFFLVFPRFHDLVPFFLPIWNHFYLVVLV